MEYCWKEGILLSCSRIIGVIIYLIEVSSDYCSYFELMAYASKEFSKVNKILPTFLPVLYDTNCISWLHAVIL